MSGSITYVFYQIAELAITDRTEARRQYYRAIDDIELWRTADMLGCLLEMSRAADQAMETCYG